jgi:hypothetical protein
VRVQLEPLVPAMEHAEEADLRAEVLGIAGNFKPSIKLRISISSSRDSLPCDSRAGSVILILLLRHQTPDCPALPAQSPKVSFAAIAISYSGPRYRSVV